ncbi:unnamed protein product [Blepharisma stoltei]|uniref:Mitochondrial import inner membrane translocase subunit n=1 Tax=Blepharisma stoltei TaxID=1481888 RepID=A0AAU9JAX3_9CILI|nr:unnamed protein product [Blepharisma stoltei]
MNQFGNLPPQKIAKINQDFMLGMQKNCLKKCIPEYKTADLSNGEKNCVDRCVFKYYEANEHLSKLFSQDKLASA